MKELKFSEIFKKNNELGNTLTGPSYSVAVLSNIITSQLNPILELSLRMEGVLAKCESGDYDNILQDSVRFADKNMLLVFWEAANLVDGFQYKANLLGNEETDQYITRFKSELDYFFSNTAKVPLVIMNTFSTTVFNHHYIRSNNFDRICTELNLHMQQKAPANTVLINTDKLFAQISVERSVDFRNYYSSKSLYTVDFYKAYTTFIKPVILSVCGKAKKALVFDCDNTLWEGIIGEDGMEGIKMSASSPKGVPYEEVQFIAKELAAKGIIIGLNSKNNAADVDEVLQKHPDLKLKEEDIVIKKVNWNDKIGNLKEIASDINIGIDSVVFVDDSDFEINLVNEYLPQVKTIQVPKEHYLYPSVLRGQLGLFYNKSESKEDAARVKMYKQDQQRETEKDAFGNMEEYLRSLQLEMTFYTDNRKLIPRIAQLTQKTNQFNLTTKRYTESEITTFMDSDTHSVYAFELKDKYGDFGITGIAIVNHLQLYTEMDTLLMSCRVLGRNIEVKFIDEIIHSLEQKGVQLIHSSYLRTPKNDQVKDLYDRLGFAVEKKEELQHTYKQKISEYRYHPLDYIRVNYVS